MEEKDRPDLKAVIEALLFAAPAPLSIRRIHEIVPGVERARIKEAILLLAHEMMHGERGIELVEAAGGWRIQTRPRFKRYVHMLCQRPPYRLSRAALETLAVIAYRQPVTRAEIEQTRGVDSSGTLRYLLDKKLIRITGRKDVPGRPLIYGTTRRFLEVFQLRDLSALPSHKELKPAEGPAQIPLFELPEPETENG